MPPKVHFTYMELDFIILRFSVSEAFIYYIISSFTCALKYGMKRMNLKFVNRHRKILLLGILATITLAIGMAVPVYSRAEKITFPAGLAPEISGLEIWLWTTGTQIITENGHVIETSQFIVPEEYIPTEAITNSGFLYTTWAQGDTYDSMCVVTPEGIATLIAHIYQNES